MPATLPLCVIGAGQIGMRHIEVAQASDRVRLTAVVEPNPNLRAALAAQGLCTVAQIEDLPSETRAAIIATPTPQHFPAAQAALDRGMAVLVEKPIGASLNEARGLVDLAAAQGLPLVTGHHRRCHPFCTQAASQIATLGQVVGIQGFWSLRKHDSYFDTPWRRRPGAGPLMTNLSHEIDLLHFLFGEIEELSAMASSASRQLQIEDTAALSLRFASGALGSFLISDAGASPWSFEAACGENPALATSGQDYIKITGTKGAMSFPSLDTWRSDDATPPDWRRPLQRRPGPDLPQVDPLLEQLNRFAAVAAGAQDDILCTGAQGQAALEFTLAAALSSQTGTPVRAGGVPGDYTGA